MFKGGRKEGKAGSEPAPCQGLARVPLSHHGWNFGRAVPRLTCGLMAGEAGASPRLEACVASTSYHAASRGLQASQEPHGLAVAGLARTVLPLAAFVPRCRSRVGEPGTGARARCRC